jgi:hypothetical protein
MDLQSLRDINNLKKFAADAKKEAAGVWNDFGKETKKLKKADKESVKKAFNQYFVDYLKTQYINFEGTVSRYSFWMYTLFAFLIGVVLGIIPYLASVYFLAILIPSVGIVCRRLQDVKLSFWWIALIFIPFYIGPVLLGCLLALPSKKEKKEK